MKSEEWRRYGQKTGIFFIIIYLVKIKVFGPLKPFFGLSADAANFKADFLQEGMNQISFFFR